MQMKEKDEVLMDAEELVDEAERFVLPLTNTVSEIKQAYNTMVEAEELLENWQTSMKDQGAESLKENFLGRILKSETILVVFLRNHDEFDFDSLEYAKDCLGDALDLIMDIEGHRVRKVSLV